MRPRRVRSCLVLSGGAWLLLSAHLVAAAQLVAVLLLQRHRRAAMGNELRLCATAEKRTHALMSIRWAT